MLELTPFQMVGDFHDLFGHARRSTPTVDIPEAHLRQALLDEEVSELREAVERDDIVEIADALGDIVYIVCGTAHAYGIPLDEVVSEIHRSNLSKLGEDGNPIYRDDGKILKGPNYSPPDIESILKRS